MTAREMVCACEDVSRKDVLEAIAHGHMDMESVKRFTGLATGICQGRACMARCAQILAEGTATWESLRPTTTRLPVWPTRLIDLAAGGPLPPLFPGPEAPALYTAPRTYAQAPNVQAPLPKRAQVVIIGGGIMGVSTAYHLAKNGVRDVVVLERGYLNAGASGRNGGGMRRQFATESFVTLMTEAMALTRGFANELGINVWLRQGGYLFLARKESQLKAMEGAVAMQNRMGVRTRLVTAQQCRKIVPSLRVDDVAGASYNPDDAVIFPWPFVWGYAEQATAMGVHLATFTEATDLGTSAGKITHVETPRGTIACDLVINAAAAWSTQVAALVDVSLPNHPERHEIMVTESLKPCLDPLVTEIDSGLYFSQSMRGEIVAGLGDPKQPHVLEMRSSLRFIQRIAQAMVARWPASGNLQVVRQWAGCYDVTPDGNPIIGEVDEVQGFYQLHGFVGHGFMMAPAVGQRVGVALAKGKNDPLLQAYRPQRFKEGKLAPPETMIIG